VSLGAVPYSERVGRSHRYRTRLTRRPRPTPVVLNSVSSRSTLLEGTIREQLVEKAAVEGDLQCPLRPKASSRRALVRMRKAPLAWSTVAMPSVCSWFPLSSEPRRRRPPKRFKPDDARHRTVRHPVQNSKLDRQAQSAPGPLTDHLENATTFGGVVPRNLAFRQAFASTTVRQGGLARYYLPTVLLY